MAHPAFCIMAIILDWKSILRQNIKSINVHAGYVSLDCAGHACALNICNPAKFCRDARRRHGRRTPRIQGTAVAILPMRKDLDWIKDQLMQR
ncbi:hypothetical protein JXA32_13160 [Candidatus Sumerlaeota bacterium]|nr:hypothetical protein [Candidatus Sumerlaeota bacterium]